MCVTPLHHHKNGNNPDWLIQFSKDASQAYNDLLESQFQRKRGRDYFSWVSSFWNSDLKVSVLIPQIGSRVTKGEADLSHVGSSAI